MASDEQYVEVAKHLFVGERVALVVMRVNDAPQHVMGGILREPAALANQLQQQQIQLVTCGQRLALVALILRLIHHHASAWQQRIEEFLELGDLIRAFDTSKRPGRNMEGNLACLLEEINLAAFAPGRGVLSNYALHER